VFLIKFGFSKKATQIDEIFTINATAGAASAGDASWDATAGDASWDATAGDTTAGDASWDATASDASGSNLKRNVARGRYTTATTHVRYFKTCNCRDPPPPVLISQGASPGLPPGTPLSTPFFLVDIYKHNMI
jgi:hypothetical protein